MRPVMTPVIAILRAADATGGACAREKWGDYGACLGTCSSAWYDERTSGPDSTCE